MLVEWIKDVMICSILFSVLIFLAPNPEMKRYIQVAVGAVMVIIVLSPVTAVWGDENRLTFNIYRESVGVLDEQENDFYVDAMKELIKNYIKEKKGVSSDIDIELSSDMSIQKLTVIVTDMESGENLSGTFSSIGESIRKDVALEYGIEEKNIQVLCGQ